MLSLLLNELMTNAVKHGALKSETGWIALDAHSEMRGDERWVRLEWQEHGSKNGDDGNYDQQLNQGET